MKKIFILFLFALFTITSVSAQISKGTWMLGGELGLGYQMIQPEERDGFTLPLTPLVGYSINDHLMVGGQFGVVGLFSDGNSNGSSQIRPFVRYFFNPQSEGNIYFSELGASFQLESDPINTYTLGLGVNRFLSPSVALEGGLGYSLISGSILDETINNFTLSIGIQAYMSRELMANRKSAEPGIGKGTIMLGTSSAAFGYVSESLFLALSPNIGYFLTDQFVIGGAINSQLNIFLDNDDFNSSTLAFLPFARYYLPIEGRCRYFTQVGAGIGQTNTQNGGFGEFDTRFYTLNALVGADVFITPNLAIELGVSFSSQYSELSGESTLVPDDINKIIRRTYDVGLNIGFQYFWSRPSND